MLDAAIGVAPKFDLRPGIPDKAELRAFINKIYEIGASDIRLQSRDFVWADVNRTWQPVSNRRLESAEIEKVLAMLSDQSSLGLTGSGQAVDVRVDMPMSADESNEFRMNATACMVAAVREGMSVTLRAIAKDIPTLERLGIEQEIVSELFPRYGLILVVGTTGSGKSTLLAASLRHRLEKRRHDPVSILTYEDPIEYSLAGLAQGYMPEPSQVGVGTGRHLTSFDQVGPNAMRRRGDVLVMGEIRDLASAKTGSELARTGHAVMATMHVDTPGQAIDRLIKFYPQEMQEGEAYGLLDQLRMVIAQKLARTKTGGKIAFRSWCVLNRTLKLELMTQPISKWSRAIALSIAQREHDFENQSLRALMEGVISGETFREVAGFTQDEAIEFVKLKGGDVRALG